MPLSAVCIKCVEICFLFSQRNGGDFMINWQPINESVDGEYLDNNLGIIPRHNYITGLKNYVLATLEQLIGYLSRSNINDDMIKLLCLSLYSVAQRRKLTLFFNYMINSKANDIEKSR